MDVLGYYIAFCSSYYKTSLLRTSPCCCMKHPDVLIYNIPMSLEETPGCFECMIQDLSLLVSMFVSYYNHMK